MISNVGRIVIIVFFVSPNVCADPCGYYWKILPDGLTIRLQNAPGQTILGSECAFS